MENKRFSGQRSSQGMETISKKVGEILTIEQIAKILICSPEQVLILNQEKDATEILVATKDPNPPLAK